jgi:DNA-binding NtrC family response regulator
VWRLTVHLTRMGLKMARINSATTVDGRTRRAAPQRPRPTLRHLFDADGKVLGNKCHELRPGRLTMGRAVEADHGLLVDDPRASRVHATLHVASRSFKVRIADEDSRHGTWVNAERVDEAWLEDGDVIRIGDSFFFLRYEPSDVPDATVPSLLGVAPVIRQLRADIAQVAKHDVTVMVLGESGSGKEVVARALHQLSGRSGPFVPVNCAAIPEQLAESQLFGHMAGAFTGARADHEGFFRAGHGGTVFLDEIGDLPLVLQPKLLRALEQRTVTPVGATRAQPFDARIVVATHRDLEVNVREESFRGDLYARLAQFELGVPALRERREDVLLLLMHALDNGPIMEPDLVEALLEFDWPYNVRELFAVASELKVRGERAGSLSLDMVEHRLAVGAERAERSGSGSRRRTTSSGERASTTSASGEKAAPPTREEFERLVAECKGNVRAIARATGRSRMQVYRWVEQYGLDLACFRD